MSKIGNYNMELEEELRDQLNELGFETLQDALAAGYVVTEHEIGGILTPVLWKVPTMIDRDEADKAYEQAQKDWEKEKAEVLEIIEVIKKSIENAYCGGFDPMFAAVTLSGNTDDAIRYSDLIKVEEFIEKTRF